MTMTRIQNISYSIVVYGLALGVDSQITLDKCMLTPTIAPYQTVSCGQIFQKWYLLRLQFAASLRHQFCSAPGHNFQMSQTCNGTDDALIKKTVLQDKWCLQ